MDRATLGARRPLDPSWLRVGLAALVAAAALASCGGSSTPRKPPESPVAIAWRTFFDGSTPTARRVALVEHGALFASAIRAQASSAMARGVTVKVTKVVTTSARTAAVTYTIFVGGAPMLQDQTGAAIKEGGIWKVSAASFCGLLALEHVSSPGCR